MPATEQTWRQQPLLHKIFAVTGVVMLIATVWMFAADHSREWKPIQRKANQVEITMTDWRKLQFETEEAVAQHRELVAALDLARRDAFDPRLLEEFQREVKSVEETADDDLSWITEDAAAIASVKGQPEAETLRAELIEELNAVIKRARFREDTLLGQRKFKAADRDAAVAELGLMVRDNKPLSEQDQKQAAIDELKASFEELTRDYQAASAHRKQLQELVRQLTEDELLADEALLKNQAELVTLAEARNSRRSSYFDFMGPVPIPGKKWLELPILDAFNSPRKIENLWSDDLEIDYNFGKVRRFDRCTTCHQLIEKSMPGTADVAAYAQEEIISFVLPPPPAEGEASEETSGGDAADAAGNEGETDSGVAVMSDADADGLDLQRQLEKLYGLRLADEGLLERTDVTVQYVRPESLAAQARVKLPEGSEDPVDGVALRAAMLTPDSAEFLSPVAHGPGLQTGDVIIEVNEDGNAVYDPERTLHRLLGAAESGEDVVLTVRRGMPSPYASHPRLDLFVGSLSPHKLADFACSICHEGQGSATEFKWASHSPNSVRERKDWKQEYGWFDNHHWIYPMYPQRFAESSCLKCHHDVAELEPSEQFPEPPAPSVVGGFHLVRKYGCFGCHEINGYDGQDRVGPDMRLEPNFFAAAQQIQADPGYDALDDLVKAWTQELVQHPERDDVRRRLYEQLVADGTLESPSLGKATHDDIVPLLRDVDNPGDLRKAGPSLRFIGQKVEADFLNDWIRNPSNFRPSTRMPQFFGMWSHLDEGGKQVSERYEPIEVQGVATYLLNHSQEYEYLTPPEGTAEPSIDRGKILFEERGCLACHSHKDFPDAEHYRGEGEIVQGPELSGVGDKFGHSDGQRWLYSWIKEPTRYHPRTVMPDLYLDPIEDADGNVTDPAADIVAYLLSNSKIGYEPPASLPVETSDVNEEALADLTLEHLRDAFSNAVAEQYVKTGIPVSMEDELRGAEKQLLVAPGQPLSVEQKLNYIGEKTISKYGCYGCHDIAGFEGAKPIGTGLADWGRKNPAQLAFEHITHYLDHQYGGHGDAHNGHADTSDSHEGDPHGGDTHGDDAERARLGLDEIDNYFIEQIHGHHRSGFAYQKLREPRSYDYHKTENKGYNERLRMPQFPFDEGDREKVITFVLGLVADPPAAKYIYQPTEHRRAILQGQEVLQKYNCAGCHVLEPQKWAISYEPDAFGEQQLPSPLYPFLHTHVPSDELADALAVDRSGERKAVVSGMPTLADDGLMYAIDKFGDPVEADFEYDTTQMEYYFDIWQSTVLDGDIYEVGVQALPILSSQIRAKNESNGGFLAKYLLPRVTEREKQINPAAKGSEAWGWVPPPLVGQGEKVQTDWLHEFLLNPYPIRPAVVLRMPRFNMTPEEATHLVNYFAAVDNVEYPYQYNSRTQSSHLAETSSAYQQKVQEAGAGERTRFEDAMKIIVDNNYCVKCHLVGDFEPKGADRAKAPNLSEVYRRLRPDFMRDWIANPKSILPYTSMPVNIPYDPNAPHLGGVSQDLYHGTSIEQVDALVDLLMNYDEFSKQRNLISPLVQEPPATEGDSPDPNATTGTNE